MSLRNFMPSSMDGTMFAKLLAVSCVLALAHDFPF